MGDKSGIGWTDATWNPVTGCSRVSPGCEHCYAEVLSLRRGWSTKPWTAQNAAENVVLHPERLDQPLHWRKPRRVFVNSMSDLFHEQVPDDFIDRVFAVMALCGGHTFQVLTKRPGRMRQWFARGASGVIWDFLGLQGTSLRWPLPNVWLGVSVEDQRRFNERAGLLAKTPAAVRFLSCEPLLGPISWNGHTVSIPWAGGESRGGRDYSMLSDFISWVIVGGESGPGHRPMDLAWLESIVRQCQAANVPVYVKQDSGARPGQQGRIPDDIWALKEFPA